MVLSIPGIVTANPASAGNGGASRPGELQKSRCGSSKVRRRAEARALSEVEDEDFYDAVCIAAMRLVRRPGNARNAVATAAISANRQADKKT